MSTRITELSPLDQIRFVEAEVARQFVAAREAAERKIAEIRIHAEQIVFAARDSGRKTGEQQYKNITISAEEEAQTIIARAQQQVMELRQRGKQRMEALTLITINTINGLKGEAPADEH